MAEAVGSNESNRLTRSSIAFSLDKYSLAWPFELDLCHMVRSC
jgi:hypothetical protein